MKRRNSVNFCFVAIFLLMMLPVRAEEEANRLNEKFNSYGIPAIPATYAKLEWRREPQLDEQNRMENRLNQGFNSYGIPTIPASYAKLEWRLEPQVEIQAAPAADDDAAAAATKNEVIKTEQLTPETETRTNNEDNVSITNNPSSSQNIPPKADIENTSKAAGSSSLDRILSHAKMGGTELVKSGGHFTLSFAEGAGQILDTVTHTGTYAVKSLYDLKKSFCDSIFSGIRRLAGAVDGAARKGFELTDSTIDYFEKYGRNVLDRVEATLK